MRPTLRISAHGVVAVTLSGLTSEQAAIVRALVTTSDSGAGPGPAPSLSPDSASPGLVLAGDADRLRSLSRAISAHGGFPPEITRNIDSLLDNYLRSDYKIECRGHVLDLGRRTHVMGILNATPDSFSDGGRYDVLDRALAHAREMAASGADIIDIGGESTRPGAAPVPEEEELRRILPVIERLKTEVSVPLSVDTYKSTVAKKALQAGASIVNDISGLRFSPDMANVAAEYGAGVIIMHIKGTPRDMQQSPVYTDVVGEIKDYLEEGIERAVRAGVDREKIMIDPGIGFGKTLGHNLEILDRLDEFKVLGRPIVLGTSRKKFIGAVVGAGAPDERIYGTAATVALGIERGAAVVRVHDVAAMAQVARMTDAILKNR